MPIGADGKAIIPHDSEIGKLLFHNAGGKAEFIGKYAEVAEMVQNKEGVDQVRILATHVGKGLNVAGMYEETVETAIPHTVIEDLPGVVHGENYEIDPPLFIPIFGRRPMEPTEAPPMPYYAYGRRLTEQERRNYESIRSKALREDPDATLDHFQETERYLGRQERSHVEAIEEAATQMGNMRPECRLSICIPVAGHQEGDNIYSTLENYLLQTADPKTFELALFINSPETYPDGTKVKPDKTISEIRRFQKDHPEVNVRVMSSILPNNIANMGYIRKRLNDTVLLRHHQRGNTAPDLIMVSNDADNKGLAPSYVENFIEKFDSHPEADAMLGQLDWDPSSYIRNPLIHVGVRMFQYIAVNTRAKNWFIDSSGANFAFRSSTYSGVGGYTEGRGGGEDTDLGEKIKLARQGAKTHKPVIFAGARVSRLYTSSRRAEKAIKDGLAPVEMWDKGFGAFEDEVRKVKWEEMGEEIDFENKVQLDKFVGELEKVINRTIAKMGGYGGNTQHPSIVFALKCLGIKYEVVDDYSIRITDASKLIEGLKDYQSAGMDIWKLKTGRTKSMARKQKEEKRSAPVGAGGSNTEKAKSRWRSLIDRISSKLVGASKGTEIPLISFYKKDRLELADVPDSAVSTETVNLSEKVRVLGDYRLAEDVVLSEGSTGKIVGAVRISDGTPMVAKEMTGEAMRNMAQNHDIPLEFSDVESYLATKNFSHPNVLTATDRLTETGHIIRMYEAGGVDLEKYLERKGSLPPSKALSIMIRLCDGLDALHEVGVVHADIAPLNIILSKDTARIIDLDGGGIDRGDGQFKRVKSTGNRFILPPEMFAEPPRFGYTVDTYEAGANLYRLLAGKWPYQVEEESFASKPEELRRIYADLHKTGKIDFPETIPEGLRLIISKAMDPEPSKRYQTMKDLIKDLTSQYEKEASTTDDILGDIEIRPGS